MNLFRGECRAFGTHRSKLLIRQGQTTAASAQQQATKQTKQPSRQADTKGQKSCRKGQ